MTQTQKRLAREYEMNGIQKIANANVKHAVNWIIGGYYNMYLDECLGKAPSNEELIEEIYESAMNNWYGVGCEKIGKAPKEMRFAGAEFIRDLVKTMVEEDEDVKEMQTELGTR